MTEPRSYRREDGSRVFLVFTAEPDWLRRLEAAKAAAQIGDAIELVRAHDTLRAVAS